MHEHLGHQLQHLTENVPNFDGPLTYRPLLGSRAKDRLHLTLNGKGVSASLQTRPIWTINLCPPRCDCRKLIDFHILLSKSMSARDSRPEAFYETNFHIHTRWFASPPPLPTGRCWVPGTCIGLGLTVNAAWQAVLILFSDIANSFTISN